MADRRGRALVAASGCLVLAAGIALVAAGLSRPGTAFGETAGRRVEATEFRALRASFVGRPLVVNFWASWCGPCYEEAPVLAAAARRHGSSVGFMGLAVRDAAGDATRFVRRFDLTYPSFLDPAGAVALAEGVRALPVTKLYDVDGSLARTWFGAVPEDELKQALLAVSW